MVNTILGIRENDRLTMWQIGLLEMIKHYLTKILEILLIKCHGQLGVKIPFFKNGTTFNIENIFYRNSKASQRRTVSKKCLEKQPSQLLRTIIILYKTG